MRIKILRVITIFLFLLIVTELIYIQLIRGNYFYILSKNNRIRVVPMEGRRGRILDRNNLILADNRGSFNVTIVPQEVKNPEELFNFLGNTLEINPDKLLRIYQQKVFAPFAPVAVAEDISREKAIIIEENVFRFPELTVQEISRRVYPFGRASAHVLGYVGKINQLKAEEMKEYGYTTQNIVGYSGIEEFYDRYLQGQPGGLQIEVNSRGQQVRLLSFKEPSVGEDVMLTIDERIQQIAMELLAERKGAIVVMDMNSGEILGLASSPAYDPNVFVRNISSEISGVVSAEGSPLLNRAIRGQYPPGSVFKLPVAMCALDAGKIFPGLTFDCPGYYRLGNSEFGCTHVHGNQDLTGAIAHSCNVYFYHVGLIAGPELIHRYARILGLGEKTKVDLPYEASGFIPSPQQRRVDQHRAWYKGDTLNFSIGQGDVLATPIQLTKMMAILGNNGKVYQPHLLKSVGSSPVSQTQERLISMNPKTLEALQIGMAATVRDPSGTANILDIPGLFISGKTGTAQSSRPGEHHAWFAGYCLTNKAKLAFCVFLEFGGSSHNACEIAHDLLVRIQEAQIL